MSNLSDSPNKITRKYLLRMILISVILGIAGISITNKRLINAKNKQIEKLEKIRNDSLVDAHYTADSIEAQKHRKVLPTNINNQKNVIAILVDNYLHIYVWNDRSNSFARVKLNSDNVMLRIDSTVEMPHIKGLTYWDPWPKKLKIWAPRGKSRGICELVVKNEFQLHSKKEVIMKEKQ